MLAAAIIFATAAQAAGIPLALLTRRLVDMASAGRAGGVEEIDSIRRAALVFAIMLAALSIGRGLCRWLQGVFGERFAQRVIADVRLRMLEQLQRTPIGYFDRRAAGKVVIRFVGDATGLRGWLANTLVRTPADALTIAGVALTLGLINWRLLVAAAAPPIVLVPLILLLNPSIRRLTRDGRREQSRLTGELTDRIEIMGAIKATGAESASFERLSSRVLAISEVFASRGVIDAWCRGVALAAGSLSICAIGYWGAGLVISGQGTAGDILAAVWFTVLIRGPINRLGGAMLVYQRCLVTTDRIRALLNRKPEPGFGDDRLPYTGEAMRIRFKNVGYHDRRGQWIIRGLTETIEGPGCVLVAGRGRAVDTLFELILRIRRPHTGRLALDRVNARKLRTADIRGAIGWVDRARGVVPATLASTGHDRVLRAWAATEAMAPKEHIRTLDDAIIGGFDRTGPRGFTSLRLSVACAMANDPPILLLSNPTDGLYESEIEGLIGWLAIESKRRLILIDSADKKFLRVAQQTIRIVDTEPLHEAVIGRCPAIPA